MEAERLQSPSDKTLHDRKGVKTVGWAESALIGRGGARLVTRPLLRSGSCNPWAGWGTVCARDWALCRAACPTPPLPCRVPRAGHAGEVEQRPGRPWGLTVGKVWPKEEVASSPSRWRPGLDRGARGLRAGSRRGRAAAPVFQPISGASGAGLGTERGGGRGKQLRSWQEAPPLRSGRLRPPPAPSPGLQSTGRGARAMEAPRGADTGRPGRPARRRLPTG